MPTKLTYMLSSKTIPKFQAQTNNYMHASCWRCRHQSCQVKSSKMKLEWMQSMDTMKEDDESRSTQTMTVSPVSPS